MELIKYPIEKSAHFNFKVQKTNVVEKFTESGRIGRIQLIWASKENKSAIRLRIGNVILTERELCNEGNNISNVDGTTEIMYHADITFKPGDTFQFAQSEENIIDVTLWLSEIESPT